MLFNAYCTPIYGCPLWCLMYQYSYHKLNVAYNDAFRHLLHEPIWCSVSHLFVANNVSSFAANIRKLVYSLWRSLNASDNVFVNTALRSYLLARSPVFRRWRNILHLIFTVNVFSIVFYCMGFEPAIERE